jgi:hypothetical protein
MYSRIDVHAQFDLRDRLTANTLHDASDYIRFLGEFSTCRSRLATMGAPLTEIESIHTLMRQLPHHTTWPHFKQSISHFVQTWSEIEGTHDPPSPPNTLYTKVITRLEQECLSLQSHAKSGAAPKPGPGTEYVNLAIKKTSRNPLGVICTNCSLDNHDFNHCWKTGGGAYGQWPGGPNDPKPTTDMAAYLGDLSCYIVLSLIFASPLLSHPPFSRYQQSPSISLPMFVFLYSSLLFFALRPLVCNARGRVGVRVTSCVCWCYNVLYIVYVFRLGLPFPFFLVTL